MAILDLFGLGGQTPMPTNQTPIQVADRGPEFGSMTAGANPGILNQTAQPGALNWADGLIGIGKGLSIAGSRDPSAIAARFAEMDREQREANKPKVTPLANGAFSLITYPDGKTEIISNDKIQEFLKEEAKIKNDYGIQKILTNAQAGVDASGAKAAQKTAEEVRPLLNDVQNLKSRWGDAYNIVAPIQTNEKGEPVLDKDGKPVRGTQGIGAQVQGMFPGVAGFFGTDEAARNKILQGLTVDETLLNTARTKGAISNTEMMLFKSPIPALTDDREKVWKPWIEKRLEVLDKLEKFYQSEIERGSNPKIGGAPNAAPAPKGSGGVVRVANEQEWQALPSGTVYQDPNGVIRTKK